MAAEAMAYHRDDLQTRWDDYFAGTRQLLALRRARQRRRLRAGAARPPRSRRAGWPSCSTTVDLVVSPTTAIGSPSYDRLDREGIMGVFGLIFTAYWDGVGNPVLVVPMGFTEGGLPLSLQLAGRPFDEALLVRAGDAYQSVTDWHLQVAPAVADAPRHPLTRTNAPWTTPTSPPP